MLAKQTHIQNFHFEQWLNIFKAQAMIDFDASDAQYIISKAENIAKSLKLGMLEKHKNGKQ